GPLGGDPAHPGHVFSGASGGEPRRGPRSAHLGGVAGAGVTGRLLAPSRAVGGRARLRERGRPRGGARASRFRGLTASRAWRTRPTLAARGRVRVAVGQTRPGSSPCLAHAG